MAPSTVADYIRRHLESCGKRQKDVAREAGFEAPNIISMLKSGYIKLPSEQASVLALSVGADEAEMVCLVLKEYTPEAWAVLAPLMARDRFERAALVVVRKASAKRSS